MRRLLSPATLILLRNKIWKCVPNTDRIYHRRRTAFPRGNFIILHRNSMELEGIPCRGGIFLLKSPLTHAFPSRTAERCREKKWIGAELMSTNDWGTFRHDTSIFSASGMLYDDCWCSSSSGTPPHTPTRSHFLFVHKRLIRFSAFVRCILLHLCLFGESLWSKSVPSATQILQFTRYTYRSVAMQMQVASIQSYVYTTMYSWHGVYQYG